jgi:DNA-binding NarL/FixJ family response regulator
MRTISTDESESTLSAALAGAPIRLLVVDSRPLVRWALSHISSTSSDLHMVGESETAKDAAALMFSLQPDVVTVDCSLPDGQGWTLARELRPQYPDLGIVVLCSDGSDDLIFRALDGGASAFLAKSASVEEVVGAIRHSAVAASSFTAAGLAQALRRRNQTTDRLALSTRERQVLGLLREGHSVPEVASTLFVSLSTAKTYVARLYEKLGANNRAQALMTAVELGILDTQRALAG